MFLNYYHPIKLIVCVCIIEIKELFAFIYFIYWILLNSINVLNFVVNKYYLPEPFDYVDDCAFVVVAGMRDAAGRRQVRVGRGDEGAVHGRRGPVGRVRRRARNQKQDAVAQVRGLRRRHGLDARHGRLQGHRLRRERQVPAHHGHAGGAQQGPAVSAVQGQYMQYPRFYWVISFSSENSTGV